MPSVPQAAKQPCATSTGARQQNSYSESQTPSPGVGQRVDSGGHTSGLSPRCEPSKKNLPRPIMREARAPRSSGRVSGSLSAATAADTTIIACPVPFRPCAGGHPPPLGGFGPQLVARCHRAPGDGASRESGLKKLHNAREPGDQAKRAGSRLHFPGSSPRPLKRTPISQLLVKQPAPVSI